MNKKVMLSAIGAMFLLGAPSAMADDRIVTGFEFLTGTVDGNVIVESGGVAFLDGLGGIDATRLQLFLPHRPLGGDGEVLEVRPAAVLNP